MTDWVGQLLLSLDFFFNMAVDDFGDSFDIS